MAKKKNEESNEEDLEEIEELENQEIESVYPTFDTGAKEEEISAEETEEVLSEEDEELQEDLEFVMEEEEEGPEYKYLDLQLKHGKGRNHYEVFIEGQSHGFLNVLVKHLLNLEGVDLAAYKKTDIEVPKIFIKLKEGNKIKKILRDALDSLREEVVSVQKGFKNLM